MVRLGVEKSTIWVSWCLCPYLFHAFLRFTRQPCRDVAVFRCGLSHQEVWGAWPWCCALPQAQWNAPRTVSKLGGTSFHASLWQKRFKMTCILLQFKISLREFFPFMIFYLVRKSHELIQESNSRLCCIPVTYWHWEFWVVKSFAASPPHWQGLAWNASRMHTHIVCICVNMLVRLCINIFVAPLQPRRPASPPWPQIIESTSAYWVLKGFKVQLDHSVLSELLDPSKAQAIPNIWQESVREALAWYSKKSENAQKLHQFQPRVCLVKYGLQY